ncbi:MAG TPA: hypothetical protein VNI81_03650 [Candidatus Limnocylindrales bacterium]|nr:hypothetical protein [Candidatus Limnocylindrales bacterium]
MSPLCPQVGVRQSERDWAYAKRAVARAADPETVIQRIADYRAADKPNPLYDARLTVTKAQVQLSQKTDDSLRPQAAA